MKKDIKQYRYDECGLSNVLIEGLQMQDDTDEACVIMPNVYGLHRLIATDLLTTKGKMRGEEIRFIRTEIGLTPKDLGELMDKGEREIKHVEKGSKSLSVIDEAWFRSLAMERLELNEGCLAADILGWCQGIRRKKGLTLQALHDPKGQPVGEYRISIAA